MARSEFSIIEHYFAHGGVQRDDVVLGIGDDGAVLSVAPGHDLVVAIDTLVAGVHFPANTPAAAIGHKALAVNLSDLAAMGADPCWATLAITLPRADEGWLQDFSRGFFALAREYQLALVGGDTTQGPLTVTVQVHGQVPKGHYLRRGGARPGDLIYVTGTLGDAGLALGGVLGDRVLPPQYETALMQKLHWPKPRVAVGRALRPHAHAAIDISDGLAADLGHILTASHVGAKLYAEHLPASEALRAVIPDDMERYRLMLSAGDDYELCFTAPAGLATQLEKILADYDCALSCIGEIEATPGLRIFNATGGMMTLSHAGYDHFSP